MVAEKQGKIVGAAWVRIIPAYGHIDNQTPELAISVLPDWRGKSIGTQMMNRLFYLLRKRGYKQTSLSVQKDNPAVAFYKRLGYEITSQKVDHAGHEDYIMIKNLHNANIKDQTIYEFDMNIVCEYFSHVERQGPGSPEITLKALSFINNLPANAKVADIGCGTGGQTMVLAHNISGTIIGVDCFPDFIKLFNQNAKNQHLAHTTQGIVGNMENLPFKEEEFDLMWSEGAIYNIGFERGLKIWRKFLKTGGYVAVSEVSWFTEEQPCEIQNFWHNAYPEIDTIANKVAQMQKAGYIPVATFILPETCWTEHFYAPLIPVQEAFLKKYAGNKAVQDYINNQQPLESVENMSDDEIFLSDLFTRIKDITDDEAQLALEHEKQNDSLYKKKVDSLRADLLEKEKLRKEL